MQKTIEIKHLTREDKLRMMDALWADLLSEEEHLESPEWHKKALQETESRLAEGKERVLDWHAAKKELRKHVE
ncbi:MAG TPA: acyl-protein synthetase [Desulfobacteraceae bacterium]|nr:acyl-protein synthetase [Desulfobacteraceae bacterium]|tara:strand:+ start:30 stop:248 length:219 start_codon:yes stop_codon:yes gene_type:complete